MGLKSPLDGRWDGRGRTVCDEPLHREEEGRPHQDVLAETWLMGISPWQMGHGPDGQDATSASWTILEHVAAC
jgi:hypothetical protein